MKSKFDIVYESLKAEAQKEVVVEGFWRAAKQMLTPRLNKGSKDHANAKDLQGDFGKAAVSLGGHLKQGSLRTYLFKAKTQSGDDVDCKVWISDVEKQLARNKKIKMFLTAGEGGDKRDKVISTSWTEPEFVDAINDMLAGMGGLVPIKNAKEQKADAEAEQEQHDDEEAEKEG